MSTEDPSSTSGWSEETSRLFIDYGRYFVPERDHQMQIMVALLSHLTNPAVILELCCGEGLLAERLLDAMPSATVFGLDGSDEMLQQARKRLGRFGDRFRPRLFNLASADWRAPGYTVEAVVASMAIHHLTGPQKQQLFGDLYRMLAAGGVLVIADIVEHSHPQSKGLAAESWDQVVRERAIELDGHTAAFEFFRREGWNTFRYLDPEDIDKPSPLFDQLKWLEDAGFAGMDVHWMRAGHAVFSARKS